MGRFGVGQAIVRLEDERLLTGGGRYTDDVSPAGQVAAVFVRSPHAHAEIRAVRTDAARAMPGVLAVLTVDDLDAAGMGNLPCRAPTRNRDGQPVYVPPRPPLARGRVRHVGDPVACVVAATLPEAREAAEAVEVDYAPLSAASDPVRALEPGAPQLWPDAPGNLALDWESGDREAVDRLLAGAARVTVVDLVNNRVVPNAMEPRALLGEFDEASGRYTLRTGGQGVHSMQGVLAEMMGLEPQQIRVIQADVGGGFGMKTALPRIPGLAAGRPATGRPVKWISDRSEGFVADTHGRDHVTRPRSRSTPTAGFLGAARLDSSPTSAPTSRNSAPSSRPTRRQDVDRRLRVPGGPRRVPGAYTNTVPVDAYRGAGRPEAAYAVERAGRRGGPRPRHRTRPSSGGATSSARSRCRSAPRSATTYDSGEFARLMDAALDQAEATGFPQRRAAARAKGKLRGLGHRLLHRAMLGRAGRERADRGAARGPGAALIGTQSNGQGHATAYAQLISGVFGIEPGQSNTIQGDTDLVATARGTGGSRSVPVGGVAPARGRGRGEAGAARRRDAGGGRGRHRVVDGRYRVARHRPRRRPVRRGRGKGRRERGLDGTGDFSPRCHTFPNGCHIVEVEIDPDTGVREIVRYTIVDDFGVHHQPADARRPGARRRGAGHRPGAARGGGLRRDRAVPGRHLHGLRHAARRRHLPDIAFSTSQRAAADTNPLGMKGAGEAGAIGAPPPSSTPSWMRCADLGVRHVDMPATPERLWRLIAERSARAA